MNTVRIDKKGARMIAHAGLAKLEPPNSTTGFVAAGSRSYYGIETDIRRTRDGRFVAFHDRTLQDRAGVFATVEESTFEEISSLILCYENGKRDRRDLIIPTLEDYINICKRYEKEAIIELSGKYERPWVKDIIGELECLGYLDRTVFISFYYDNLLYVKEILPSHPVQFIFSEPTDELTDRLIRDGIDADIRFTCITEAAIKKLHDGGRRVNCFTVDSPEIAERLALMGVDFITSNILE